MQNSLHNAQSDWPRLIHKWTGLLSLPFLLLSIVLAVGLTHTKFLDALSDRLYPSLPIPQVNLGEPVQAGSWDQALALARLAVGKTGHVITSRDDDIVEVQSFEEHTHDPAVAKTNRHLKIEIDTRTMRILRVSDNSTSLVNKGHSIHAFRLFDWSWFSLSVTSSLALILLLLSGGALAWRDRKVKKTYTRASLWHVRAGQAIVVFLLVIIVTTLDFEFGFFGNADKSATLPIPVMQLNAPLRLGSLDQARNLVKQATGALPRAAFIRDGGNDVKFSEAGDGIGGKSTWMNINTHTINRITDWHNDRQAFSFIIHDGRWLGGMNAFNINDAVALVLLFLVLGGAAISWRERCSAGSAAKGGVEMAENTELG